MSRTITKTEVINSYEFKLLGKLLKNRFPFVKELVLNEDHEVIPEDRSLIFFDVIINYQDLLKHYGQDNIEDIVIDNMTHKLLPNWRERSLIFRRFLKDKEMGDKVNNDMSKVVDNFRNHANLPDNMRLPMKLSRVQYVIKD
jgi:hypothetical protein